jgi:hypothetical protein
MPTSTRSFPLPPSLLPTDLDSLPPRELTARGRATNALKERRHFELGRLIAYVYEQPRRFGYASAIDWAEAEVGVREREAYHLLRLELETRKLPALREAYQTGEVPFSHAREVVKVATPETDERWTREAKRLPFRAIYARVHGEGEASAARGEGPWPDSGLHGPLGRTEPLTSETRPFTPALKALEAEVWELHNRLAGHDTGWRDFFEAMLVSYKQDLEGQALALPPTARAVLERDGWRCRVPHCSRRAALHIHHGVHRSQGGDDAPDRLLCLCEPHHRAHHEGLLEIRGSESKGWRFRHRPEPGAPWEDFPPGGEHRYDPLERAWDGPTYVREGWIPWAGPERVFKSVVTGDAARHSTDVIGPVLASGP